MSQRVAGAALALLVLASSPAFAAAGPEPGPSAHPGGPLGELQARNRAIRARGAQIDQGLKALNAKMGRMDAKAKGAKARLAELDARMKALDAKLKAAKAAKKQP